MAGVPGYSVPKSCTVTGGSGFVGKRLVEMLVERGARRVVSFDIAPKPADALDSPQIVYIRGDLTNYDEVEKACEGSECVFHVAALVGPYHPEEAFLRVNYHGTLNVLNACNKLGIKKIVMSSSPSTRFPYPDPNVDDLTEEQLRIKNKGEYAPVFMQPYAKTKAMGEKAILDACGSREGDLLTIAVAPHQVYGPGDALFLPHFLEVASSGKLRIFGSGENRISFCHVDNYCHGLILGAEALRPGSPALGKFYIVTDGAPQKFWRVIDEAIVEMGFQSLFSKTHLPVWFMLFLGYLALFLGNMFAAVTGVPKHKVNYYLKLNPFVVKMLIIHRVFNTSAARRDLKYEPLIEFDEGWRQTKDWFKTHWLPKHLLALGTQKQKQRLSSKKKAE